MITTTALDEGTTMSEQSEADRWAAEVGYLLDDLAGGTLTRLEKLAASPPAGAAVFAALAAVVDRLDIRKSASPEAAAAATVGGWIRSQLDRTERAAADLLSALQASADRAVDAGSNDTADPIIRVADVPTGTGTVPPFSQPVTVAYIGKLPADHPLRTLTPLDDNSNSAEAMVILGNKGATRYRLSVAKAMTGKAVQWRDEQTAERKRIEALEEAARQAAWQRSAEGQAAHVRELERQLQLAAAQK